MPWRSISPSSVADTRRSLDLPVLRDGGHTCCQAAGEPDEHVLDRGGAVVLGGEDLGVVGVEGEAGPIALLLAESEEALDLRPAVGPVLPLAGCPPPEGGGLGRLGERIAGAEQGFDVDRCRLGCGSWSSFCSPHWGGGSVRSSKATAAFSPSKCSFV